MLSSNFTSSKTFTSIWSLTLCFSQVTSLMPLEARESTPPPAVRLHVPLTTNQAMRTIAIALEQKSEQEPSIYPPNYLQSLFEVLKRDLELTGFYQQIDLSSARIDPCLEEELLSLGRRLPSLSSHLTPPPASSSSLPKPSTFINANAPQKLCQALQASRLHLALHLSLAPHPSKKGVRILRAGACKRAKGALPYTLHLYDSGPLTGDLAIDRRAVHQMVDELSAFFVGAKPLLSSRILFVKTQASQGSSSGDGGKKFEERSEIWESDLDGENGKKLCQMPYLIVSPIYVEHFTKEPASFEQLPRLLFVAYQSGQAKIYLFRPGEGAQQQGSIQRITSLEGNQLAPSISSQGVVSFINDSSGNPEVWTQQLHLAEGRGAAPKLFFEAKEGTQATPFWSPDASMLYFISSKDGRPRLFRLPFDPSGTKAKPQLLTRQAAEATSPSISRCGKKILYCMRDARLRGARQIWLLDLEKQGDAAYTQLTSGPGNKENPVWASDDLHILFNMDFGQKSDLYMIDLHQRNPRRLTNFSCDVRFPQCRDGS